LHFCICCRIVQLKYVVPFSFPYAVLTGFPPYDQASRTDQRFELIVSGRLMEQLRNWDIFLTDEAGDLIQSMLQLDPRERLTLAEVMSHPWVTNAHVQAPDPPEPRLVFH
jgi:serine/threonine protein kinase